jgi:hypothetical protein
MKIVLGVAIPSAMSKSIFKGNSNTARYRAITVLFKIKTSNSQRLLAASTSNNVNKSSRINASDQKENKSGGRNDSKTGYISHL